MVRLGLRFLLLAVTCVLIIVLTIYVIPWLTGEELTPENLVLVGTACAVLVFLELKDCLLYKPKRTELYKVVCMGRDFVVIEWKHHRLELPKDILKHIDELLKYAKPR